MRALGTQRSLSELAVGDIVIIYDSMHWGKPSFVFGNVVHVTEHNLNVLVPPIFEERVSDLELRVDVPVPVYARPYSRQTGKLVGGHAQGSPHLEPWEPGMDRVLADKQAERVTKAAAEQRRHDLREQLLHRITNYEVDELEEAVKALEGVSTRESPGDAVRRRLLARRV